MIVGLPKPQLCQPLQESIPHITQHCYLPQRPAHGSGKLPRPLPQGVKLVVHIISPSSIALSPKQPSDRFLQLENEDSQALASCWQPPRTMRKRLQPHKPRVYVLKICCHCMGVTTVALQRLWQAMFWRCLVAGLRIMTPSRVCSGPGASHPPPG